MKQSNGAACLGIKKFTPSILLLNPEKNILNPNFFERAIKAVQIITALQCGAYSQRDNSI